MVVKCVLLKTWSPMYFNPVPKVTVRKSLKTVKGYRQNLLFKLGAKNTSILVGMAINQKLV
jgi:hypothetical protein